MKVLVILGVLALALARPSKRCNDDDDWKHVLYMTEADLEEVLKHVPVSDIKDGAAKINADLTDVQKFLAELKTVQEPLDKNGDVDPRFISAAAFFERAKDLLEDDMAALPPIPDDLAQTHFLGDCIKKAESTDFDSFNDYITLVNEVVRQVVSCAADGVDVMVDSTDLTTLADVDITAKELAGRLEKIRGVVIEMNHLGEFLFGFIGRMEQGMYGTVSNNELVHGKDDGPKPTPNTKRVSTNIMKRINEKKEMKELEARLLERVLSHKLSDKRREGGGGRPRPTGGPVGSERPPTGSAPPATRESEQVDTEAFLDALVDQLEKRLH